MKKLIALLLTGFAATLAHAEYIEPSLTLISIYQQNVAPEHVSTQMNVIAYGADVPYDSVAMTGPGGRVLGVPPNGIAEPKGSGCPFPLLAHGKSNREMGSLTP